MTQKGILSLLFLSIIFSNVIAQENNEEVIESTTINDSIMQEVSQLKWRKKLFIADQLVENGSQLNAIQVYEMVLNDKPNDVYTLNQLGEINYFMRHYAAATKWFDKLVAIDSLTYPYSQYYLAKSLKHLGRYEEAIPQFDKFHATMFKKQDDQMIEVKSTLVNEIEGCKEGIAYKNHPVKVRIEHLGGELNHPLTDLSPRFLDKDKMLYSALGADTAISIQDTTEGRFTRFFVSERRGEEWQTPNKYDFPFNNGPYHVGNGAFSIDGKTFYFTRCKEQEDLSMQCNIYISHDLDTTWSQPELLDAINSEDFSSTHPMVGQLKDGNQILFFSSDMPGGYGNTDIWIASIDADGKISNIRNPGTPINTSDDDVTPFFDNKSQTLYFSSKGLINIGGYDVYSSEYDSGGIWSEPVNLGYPLNSSVDDLYFAFAHNNRSGYLVSNRPGGLSPKSPTCCDDIWGFQFPPAYVFLAGTLYEEGSDKKLIEGGLVQIYQADNDSLVASIEINETGQFKTKLAGDKKYKVVATGKKYEETTFTLATDDREDGEVIKKDIFLKKRPFWEGLNVGIVYYDFDRSKLRKEARPVLDTLVEILKSYPTMIIEIAGHTDDMGDTLYNKILSERRAEAVYNYLLRKDIPAAQLVQKGYGEKQPVAPNKKPDGSDNPEGRQQNRRVEFSVVGELKEL